MADCKSKGNRQIQSEVGELRDRVEAQGNEIAMLRRRDWRSLRTESLRLGAC